jgi:cytochrome b561
MARIKHPFRSARARLPLWQRVTALFALLALLLTGFGLPAAALASPADADRAATLAFFGAGVLCEPAGSSDAPAALPHSHHCVLCATARLDIPAVEAIAAAFLPVTQRPAVRVEVPPLPLSVGIAARPHKPRDPPAFL